MVAGLRIPRGNFLVVAALFAVACAPGAAAAILTGASADDLVGAMDATPLAGWSATFTSLASPEQAGLASTPIGVFPAEGSEYAILSTGDAAAADDPNDSPGTSTDYGAGPERGTDDLDVVVLHIEFTACFDGPVKLRYQFLSDEFPEYWQTIYKDTFLVELDGSTWTTTPSGVVAPDALLVKDVDDPYLTMANAGGSTYDAASSQAPTLSTWSVDVTTGPHTLDLSLLDFHDGAMDSAVFLDRLALPCCDAVSPPSVPEMVSPSYLPSDPLGPVFVDWFASEGCPEEYHIYRREITMPWPATPIATVAVPTTEYLDTNADPCKTYDYRVTASRTVPVVLESAPSSYRTGGWRVSHGPTNFWGTADEVSGDVQLSWTGPTTCRTEYHISRWPPGGLVATVPAPTTNFTDPGFLLTHPCVEYSVSTHNHDASPPHDILSISQRWQWIDPDLDAPLLSVSEPDLTSALLSWTPGPCPGRYDILRSDVDMPYVWAWVGTVANDVNEFLDTTVNACNTYHYVVVDYLNIESGAQVASNTVTVVKPVIPPSPPSGTTASQSGDVDWTQSPPLPCRADDYDIDLSYDGGLTWSVAGTVPHPLTAGQVVITSGCGAQTWVRVRGTNVAGSSPPSNVWVHTAAPTMVPPNQPTSLAGTMAPDGPHLLWTAPLPTGCVVDAYHLFRRTWGDAAWPTWPLYTGPNLHFEDPSWDGCTTYEYQVRAFNAAGNSTFRGPASVTTPVIVPNAPLGVTGTPDGGIVAVQWVTPQANGCPIDGYHVQRGALRPVYGAASSLAFVPAPGMVTPGAAWRHDDTVVDDVQAPPVCGYWYTVSAFNAAGEGPTGLAWGVDLRAIAAALPLGDTAGDILRSRCFPPDAPDVDLDGIEDVADNCRDHPNPNQEDRDGDGVGDACVDGLISTPAQGDVATDERPDADLDGIDDLGDNCRDTFNPTQEDLDEDGAGDACDADRDGDGAANSAPQDFVADNCAWRANADQRDGDDDGIGDACDPSTVLLAASAEEAAVLPRPAPPVEGYTGWLRPAFLAITVGAMVGLVAVLLAARRRHA